jgi:hypothetical protein
LWGKGVGLGVVVGFAVVGVVVVVAGVVVVVAIVVVAAVVEVVFLSTLSSAPCPWAPMTRRQKTAMTTLVFSHSIVWWWWWPWRREVDYESDGLFLLLLCSDWILNGKVLEKRRTGEEFRCLPSLFSVVGIKKND